LLDSRSSSLMERSPPASNSAALRCRLFPLLLSLLALAGCSSLSDALFLLHRLDDQEKARVLTAKGIQLYEAQLEQGENYEMIPTIRRYFEVALRYDPLDARAASYLRDLQDFARRKVAQKVALVQDLLDRDSRSEEDSYRMCLAAWQAYSLDTGNAEARELYRETRGISRELAAEYAQRGRLLAAGALARGSDQGMALAYAEAIGCFQRILAMEPDDEAARSEEGTLQQLLTSVLRRELAAVSGKLEEGGFEQACAEMEAIREVDRRAGGRLSGELDEAASQLNYRWAAWLFERKQYMEADARVDVALAFDRRGDALALKRQIAAALQQRADEAAFARLLQKVDELVGQEHLGAANQMILSALSSAKGPAQRRELESRAERIRQAIAGLYWRGVALYREERFREAVELLQIVVEVDPGYEQAESYLEKARSKQELLDSL
jgi:tetratricopeptide (TPR) repeat protein